MDVSDVKLKNNNIIQLNKINETTGGENTDSSDETPSSYDDLDKKDTIQTTERTLEEEEEETVLQKDGLGKTDLLDLKTK